MTDVDLTVLFATRNGASVLPRTLEAYCQAEKPTRGWKIVIVDNGSEDATPAILASFKKRLPLETLREPIAGQNRARNFGLDHLEGQLAILTDDDAIPDSSFLTAWSKYYDKCQDYELFGGSIDPLFEESPPKWIYRSKSQFEMLFAARDLSEGPISPNEIFGPNMAVRTSIFAKGFRFREDLGPNGSDPNYPMGGETELFRRMAAQTGAKAWFAKEPRVQHIVRSNQLESSYWAKRSYQHGRGSAQQAWDRGPATPRGLLRRLMYDQPLLLRYWLQMFSPFALQRFDGICHYHWRRGYLDEWAKRSNPCASSNAHRKPVI